MDGERAQRCETCRFWDEHCESNSQNDMTGDCRRYPPLYVMAQLPEEEDRWTAAYSGGWPETLPNEWCGEWQQKPVEEPAP